MNLVLLFLLLLLLLSRKNSGRLRKKCPSTLKKWFQGSPQIYYRPGDHLISVVVTATKTSQQLLQFNDSSSISYHIKLSSDESRILCFIFATQVVNKNPQFLHNFTLGYSIHDNYFNTLRTSDALLDMLSTGEINVPNYSCGRKDKLLALIDGADNDISIQMSTLVGTYKIPQISYGFTSEALSDKNQFPFFYRMAPKEGIHYPAIVQVLLHFRWTLIGLFAPETEDGENFMRTFTPMLVTNGICVVISQRFSMAGLTDLIRDAIFKWKQVNVFVYFTKYGTIVDRIFPVHVILEGLLGPIEGKVWIISTYKDLELNRHRFFKHIHSIWTFDFQEKTRPKDYASKLNLFVNPNYTDQSFRCSYSKKAYSVKFRKRCTQKVSVVIEENNNSIRFRNDQHVYSVVKTLAHALNAAYSSRLRRIRKKGTVHLRAAKLQPWQVWGPQKGSIKLTSSREGIQMRRRGTFSASLCYKRFGQSKHLWEMFQSCMTDI